MGKQEKFVPVVKQVLNFEVLQLKKDTPIYIKPLRVIFEGKQTGDADDKKADIMACINLEDGKEYRLLVPTMVKGILEENFDSEYVNKKFAITKGDKVEGKRYYHYKVEELE